MRTVVQRVLKATVSVDNEVVGQTGPGLLLLLGVHHSDTESQAEWLANKIAGLRIFHDEAGKMNKSVVETKNSALVVSQFTLYGNCRSGRRPDFFEAARPEKAEPLYLTFVELLSKHIPVETGQFGGMMEVELINDGPVTLIVDTAA